MSNERPKNKEDQNIEKKKKDEEELPVCTSAPSAEQARAHDDDEPCDDSRKGEIDCESGTVFNNSKAGRSLII